jgi:site-specific recombinase XerD
MSVTSIHLDIYEPSTMNLYKSSRVDTDSISYFYTSSKDFYIKEYLPFPLIISEDGIPWHHANRYLLYRVEIDEEVNWKTLKSIADDLDHFNIFCKNNNINYLSAERKILRPTFQYRKELISLHRNKGLAINTVKRRLSRVRNFYEWLIDIENKFFKFPLWKENEKIIMYSNKSNNSKSKVITTTDLTTIKNTHSQSLPSEMHILDDGKLHPLSYKEQEYLIQALNTINNIQMKLIFLIALTSGARIQTICTLRLKHFLKEIPESDSKAYIPVGPGTDCDTKLNKNCTLQIPTELYKKIQIYILSPKAQKCRGKNNNTEKEYVFLSNRSRPYYMAHNDPKFKNTIAPPTGEAIRVFISGTLKKTLKKQNHIFPFSFHDLKATAGMNRLKYELQQEGKKTIIEERALNSVRILLCHSHMATTSGYLNYENQHTDVIKAQDEWENHLLGLLNE